MLNCDDRRNKSSPTPRRARWHRKDGQGMANHVCARHFLISIGSETTLDCQAADRAAVECPESQLALPIDDEGREYVHPTNSSRPGERAKCSAWAGCLGIAGRLQSSPTPLM